MVNDFNKKKDNAFLNLLNKIDPLIKKLMSENKIDLVLDKKNIIIGSNNSDITQDLIELINTNTINMEILNKDQIRDLLPHRDQCY